jgi:DNA-binding MarR family transcriptional regulator
MSKSALDLRRSVQGFVRAFGLLAGEQTPCGQPLAPSHAHALLVLLERERATVADGLRQQDLTTALGLDKSSITRLCARMVDAGHLQQTPSETDGRAWALNLSAKGRRVAETLEEASKARFRRLAAALPATVAVDDVLHVLEALTAAVVSSSERKSP